VVGFATLAFFAPWRETGCFMLKTGEQSENVYENKGAEQKSGSMYFTQGTFYFLAGSVSVSLYLSHRR